MASALSMSVGFKNATDGTYDAAINAMLSAKAPHSFLGIDDNGLTSVLIARVIRIFTSYLEAGKVVRTTAVNT